jgi:formate dehydrogenase maturation protein FdhE
MSVWLAYVFYKLQQKIRVAKERRQAVMRLRRGLCPQCGSPKVTLGPDDTLKMDDAREGLKTCSVCLGWAGRPPPPVVEFIAWQVRWKRQGRRVVKD